MEMGEWQLEDAGMRRLTSKIGTQQSDYYILRGTF